MIPGKICGDVRDQGGASAPTRPHPRSRPYKRIINLEAYSKLLTANQEATYRYTTIRIASVSVPGIQQLLCEEQASQARERSQGDWSPSSSRSP